MKQNALIGWTGFVGGNLKDSGIYPDQYNSSTIDNIIGKAYDRVVCAGVKSAMWLANNAPDKDLDEIVALIDKLEKCRIERLVWVSTVAVYPDDGGVYTEETNAFEPTLAYGINRRKAELMIAERFPNHCIIRLPALFGEGLKKNLIFDLTNRVPGFLNEKVFGKIRQMDDASAIAKISEVYRYDESTSMYKYDAQADKNVQETESILGRIQVSVLDFTNSESKFQYYNLEHLQRDIDRAIALNLSELNICSEPLSANEIVEALTGKSFENTAARKYLWDIRSIHSERWNHDAGYLYNKAEIIDDLRQYYKRHLRG